MCLFERGEGRGVELDEWGCGEHLGVVGEGETVIRAYYMKIIFNNKDNLSNLSWVAGAPPALPRLLSSAVYKQIRLT